MALDCVVAVAPYRFAIFVLGELLPPKHTRVPAKISTLPRKYARVPAKICARSRHIPELLGITKEGGEVRGEFLSIFRNVETFE